MRYVCQICGYVYDEEKEQIPFSELPDSWKCPLCGAVKTDFKPEGEIAEQVKASAKAAHVTELKPLSPGQLAALCSNLARGCEKQYKTKQSELFRELADYFNTITPAIDDADVEKLSDALCGDIDNYPTVRATADEAGDRGAARICVWGEKVTRILSSLVKRYITEGEAMLADTSIWICTVCGFVYIGDTPPELCPVCKVPAWKFEKIEGRVSA